MKIIKDDMIHPELRKKGKIIRFLVPNLILHKTSLPDKIINLLLKGKCRKKNLNYEQIFLPRPDGSQLRICVYSKKTLANNVPGILWLHGGGYAKGIPEQDEIFISRFIEASGCVVVSPDYQKALINPYPAALEDCYAALLWLKTHGKDYGMRDDQIMVGGDSAGGGLTAAITLYARDKGEVSLAFQMPLYPMIDDRTIKHSTDNDAPVWNSKSNTAAWKLYLGELSDKDEIPIYAAPARATDLKYLPPAVSFVGSIEVFCDETTAYMERLRQSGVTVRFKVFDGCFHAFDVFCSNTSVGQEAVAFLMEAFSFAVNNYFAPQPCPKALTH